VEGAKSMKLEMLHDNVLIKRDKPEENRVTPGGIHVPEIVQKNKKMYTALVIEVSKKVKEVKAGDTIIIGGFGGTDIKMDGDDDIYTVASISDILAVVREKASDKANADKS
jgi:chaperonin GroES